MRFVEREEVVELLKLIEKSESESSVQIRGYDLIENFMLDKFFRNMSDNDKLEVVYRIIELSTNRIKELEKIESDRRYKKFRTLPSLLLERRKHGEKIHSPKEFRHWYFYGKVSEFTDWFEARLEESYVAADITMLACTVRDELKRGLDYDIAIYALRKLNQIEKEYDLNVLKDVKGDHVFYDIMKQSQVNG